MSSIIPFILLILSLAVIILIIVKKFPQLTLLDVRNMPEVKAEKKKTEYIKRRVNKQAEKQKKQWEKKMEPMIQKAKDVQLKFRKYVGKVQKDVIIQKEKKQEAEPIEKKEKRKVEVQSVYQKGMHALEQENYEQAEKLFINAISADPKHIDAYRGLAGVYKELEQYQEAEQTYQYILKLDTHDDLTMMMLGELLEKKGDKEKAIDWYQKAVLINPHISSRLAKLAVMLNDLKQHAGALEAISQAVELEPQNPKYLDNFIELSIMSGNRKMAEQGYEELRLVNPDNQKLRVFRDRIDKLEK